MDNKFNLADSFSEVNNKVFENAAVVLALLNDNVEVVNINKSATDVIGKKKADILNKLGGEVFNCANAWSNGEVVCGIGRNCGKCVLRNNITDTFKTGNTNFKKEGYFDITVNGEIVRLRLLISTAIVTLNNEKFVLLTIDDITELKEKEDKLQEAIATKDKFFSIISHDLRGPIGSVLALSEIINDNVNSTNIEEYKEYMHLMHNEIENTFKLVENLLLWSRNQKGQIEVRPENFKVKAVAKNTIALLQGLADKKYIQIFIDIPESLGAMADKDMFSTVIRNLVSNAIKFTNNGGKITIEAHDHNDHILFSVIDSGIGIPEVALAKIFDLNVNHTTKGTNNEKGTGLGLILCKEFIEKHKGKFWITSTENVGTKVNFTLPKPV
jgi:signal transduction histidine kinase